MQKSLTIYVYKLKENKMDFSIFSTQAEKKNNHITQVPDVFFSFSESSQSFEFC